MSSSEYEKKLTEKMKELLDAANKKKNNLSQDEAEKEAIQLLLKENITPPNDHPLYKEIFGTQEVEVEDAAPPIVPELPNSNEELAKLKDEDINFIIKRYKETYNIDVDYTYDEETGELVFKNGGNVIGRCKKSDDKIEAIHTLDNQYNMILNANNQIMDGLLSNSVDNTNYVSVNKAQRGLAKVNKNKTVSQVNLDINTEEFENAISIIQASSNNLNAVNDIKSLGSNLTGDLRKWYDSQGNSISKSDIKDLKSIMDDFKLRVSTCFEMVKSTDKEMQSLLISTIDRIFNTEIGISNSQLSFEQKKENFEKLKTAAVETLNKLKDEFKAKCYDKGIPFSVEFCNTMFPILGALGISDIFNANNDFLEFGKEGKQKNGDKEVDVFYFNPAKLESLLESIEEYQVFENVSLYLEGGENGTFDKTLLKIYVENNSEALNEVNAYSGMYYDDRDDFYIRNDNDKILSLKESYERNFLSKVLVNSWAPTYQFNDGSNTEIGYDNSKYDSYKDNYLKNNNLSKDIVDILNNPDILQIKDLKSEYFDDIKSFVKYMYTDKNGKLIDFASQIEENSKDYLRLSNDVLSTKQYINQINKEIKLFEFNDDKLKDTYFSYLAKKYDDNYIKKISETIGGTFSEKIPYMSQEEFALLDMYLNDKSKSTFGHNRAIAYLEALEDDLNMRKGFDEASTTIYENGGVGVGTAFVDGITAWFDSVGNVIKSLDINSEIDPISVSQYKNMFVTSILDTAKNEKGNRGIYEELLENVSVVDAYTNKFTYTIANQVGNMLVPVVVGTVVGAATGGASVSLGVLGEATVGSIVGSSLVGAGAAGSAMANAVSRGEDNRLKVMSYGLLNGVSEASLTLLLSSIPGVGKAFQEGTSFLSGCTGEAKEEFLQTFIEAGLNKAYFNDEFNLDETLIEANKAAMYGFLLSAIFNGAIKTFTWTKDGVKRKISKDNALSILNEAGGDTTAFRAKLESGVGEEVGTEFDYTAKIKSFIEAQGKDGATAAGNIDRAYYDSMNNRIKIIMKDGTVRIYNDIKIDEEFKAADTGSTSGPDVNPSKDTDIDNSMTPEEILKRAIDEKDQIVVTPEELEILEKNGIIRNKKNTSTKGNTIVEIDGKRYHLIISKTATDTRTKSTKTSDTSTNPTTPKTKEDNPSKTVDGDEKLKSTEKDVEESKTSNEGDNPSKTSKDDAVEKDTTIVKEEETKTTEENTELTESDSVVTNDNATESKEENDVTDTHEEVVTENSEAARAKYDKAYDEYEKAKEKFTDLSDADASKEAYDQARKELDQAEKNLEQAAKEYGRSNGLNNYDDSTTIPIVPGMPSNPAVSNNTTSNVTPNSSINPTTPNDSSSSIIPTNQDPVIPNDPGNPAIPNDPNSVILSELGSPAVPTNNDSVIPSDPTGPVVPTDPNTDIITNPETEIIIPPTDPNIDPNINPNVDPNTNTNADSRININYWPWLLPIPLVGAIVGLFALAGTLTLTLKGKDVMDILQYTKYIEPGYVATDSTDGDLSSKVVVTGSVDTSKLGTYVLTYSVTNSKNETKTATRKVNVIRNSTNKIDISVRTFNSIPKKYKLLNNEKNNLAYITQHFINNKGGNILSAVGMNVIADGVMYQSLSNCDNSILNKEASLISIYDNNVESTYHDSNCYNNSGVFYFTNIGSMNIKIVNDKSSYDTVLNAKPRDTFVYQSVLVRNSNVINTSSNKTSNIAICATGSNYKVFIPNGNYDIKTYANYLKNNNCIDGVLLSGNTYYENGRVAKNSSIYYDSMLYFE